MQGLSGNYLDRPFELKGDGRQVTGLAGHPLLVLCRLHVRIICPDLFHVACKELYVAVRYDFDTCG